MQRQVPAKATKKVLREVSAKELAKVEGGRHHGGGCTPPWWYYPPCHGRHCHGYPPIVLRPF
jgi:hypothetical protein